MEIHELNTFTGTLGAADFFPTDNGTDTTKVSAADLMAPLNARIDNIIAGGTAPSASEVTDARLGATVLGGVQYASLGDAIRGQATVLASEIECVRGDKICMESGSYSESDPVSKIQARARIRSASKIPVDSFLSITFPTGYTGYGQVLRADGTRLGFTGTYVSSITRQDIRTRYGDDSASLLFVLRNDSTPMADISSEIEYVINNTVTEWVKPLGNEGRISAYYGSSADLDDVTKEGLWYGQSTNSFANVPKGFIGRPFILEVIIEGTVVIQKLTDIDRHAMAVRYKVGDGEWDEWGNVLAYCQVTESTAASLYSNLASNLPSNGMFYINTAWFNDMASSLGNKVGHLFTFAPKMFSSALVLQIFYPADQGNVSCRTRTSDAWTNWRSVASSEGDYHDTEASYYAFGDSTTYGQIGGASGRSQYNYPNCVGQMLNMVVHNHAVTNQGLIKDWSTIHTDFITNLDMTGAKLITVGWAYNDIPYYSNMNFGAYTDTGSTTFIGKYFTIMKEFQQKCPDAQVVLVTGYGYSNGTLNPLVKPTLTDQFTHKYTFSDGQKSVKEVYDTLEAMCHLHGWNCINQAKGTVFNEWNASLLIGDQIHPTDDGYSRYGNNIAARIAAIYGNIKKW